MKVTEREVAVAEQNGRNMAVNGTTKAQGPLGQVLRHAVQVGASDVHIELGDNLSRVRYRINGTLKEEGPKLSRAACVAATGASKRLAGLKPEGTGIPQRGRIEWEPGRRDLLVSVAPCVGGESVVLRLLDRTMLCGNLNALQLEEPIVSTLRRWIGRPHGMVIVCGVTGSGKTTTLYALLQDLNTSARKVMSLEEPVQYRIEGITQIEVDPKNGTDYATALRCVLAQDPDVILVGELKNAETAEVALKAALTGHLVLTVMHAEDGPATIERLRDVGIEPRFINQVVIGVLGQRLVRKICGNCKVAHTPTALERKTALKGKTSGRFYRGKGCDKCGGTGYRGRAAAFELFELDDKLKALILRGASAEILRQQARKFEIPSLRDAALAKAKAGITTLSEVLG